MNDKTIRKLNELGWNDSRKINIDTIKKKYQEIGLKVPNNVELFLMKFGMLKSDFRDKIYFDVEFDPLKAIGINLDAEYFHGCLTDYGIEEDVYPIGVACRENLLVLMSKDDIFYCFTDGCLLKVGENVDDMLDCLVGECREAEEIE